MRKTDNVSVSTIYYFLYNNHDKGVSSGPDSVQRLIKMLRPAGPGFHLWNQGPARDPDPGQARAGLSWPVNLKKIKNILIIIKYVLFLIFHTNVMWHSD